MNINMNMTVTLSENDLSEIIRLHLLKEGLVMKGKIKVNVGTRSEGYGPGERDVPYFGGISVDVEPKKETHFPNSSQFQDGNIEPR
jgi:hypothetical protein